jgi:hypothetical protein
MSDLRTWWAAAGGQAPPAELVAAREGLSRRQRRAAARAVRRGEAADDPAVARLAVGLARVFLRRRPSATLIAFFALLVAGWVAFAVSGFAAGHTAVGVLFSAVTVFGAWTLNRMRPRYAHAAQVAERLNREVLERAGTPYREDAQAAAPVRPPAAGVAAGAVVLWAFYDVTFGALGDLVDGRSLEVAHVVARGALFATLMVIVNLTVMRRRTARQSQRPIA